MATEPYRRVAELVLIGSDSGLAAACEAIALDEFRSGTELHFGRANRLEEVSGTTGSDIRIVMVLVDGAGEPRSRAQIREAIENLRFKTHAAVLVFVAFGEAIADSDVARLTFEGAFDVVLQTNSPPVLVATAAALARLSEMMTSGRRRSLKRGEAASLLVGKWEINTDTRLARRADGSEAKLTASEIDYLKFLLNSGCDDVQPPFPESIAPPTSRQSALVYKLKAKLGRDLPIVSTAPETYRISGA